MLSIKVLGPGCANCRKLEAMVHKVVGGLGAEAEVVKVTEYPQIIEYGIMATPGLVVNEHLVCSGRVPVEAEIVTWVVDALEAV
jgi:small redox-active disulfide protein 2